MQLQAHLDLTQMGVGVILDVEAKDDGVAKAALVRFEGGPRTGLWYSIGSLEHESPIPAPAAAGHPAPDPQAAQSAPALQLTAGSIGGPANLRPSRDEERREERERALEALRAEGLEEGSWVQHLLKQRLDPKHLEPILRSRPESTPRERLGGFLETPLGLEAGTLCVLLFARGARSDVLARWLCALWHRFPARALEAVRGVQRSLEARPLWRWRSLSEWPSWLLPDVAGQSDVSSADAYRPRAGRLLDERQLVLRGWIFPGERMRVLLRELERGVPGVLSERDALTWIERRLRELGWWRPLRVRAWEPPFLSRNEVRSSVAGALPRATQDQLESLLRGAQHAGIVRSPGEAAAWLRAWVEVWVQRSQPSSSREAELPEALTAWDLIQRGWLLDPTRLRALRAKEERARERREPLYLRSPLAWAYCAIAELGWLLPRRPRLDPVTLERIPRVRPSQLSAELGHALRQAQSAGIVRSDPELQAYALAWIEEDRARRLGQALEREDLGGALAALGGG